MIILNSKRNEPKVFCIGLNKTGTTSIETALRDLGYKMGDQVKGELLLKEYTKRNFNAIIKYCHSAQAFQDAPFSFQHTFLPLDQYFKNAKFILTVRDSEEQWFQSLKNFHIKSFMDGKRLPNVEDLKNVKYRYEGFVWEARRDVYGFSETEDPYDPIKWKSYYRTHNETVRNYFLKKDNMLELNLSDESSYIQMCNFLNVKPKYQKFPWKNKTKEHD